MKEDVILKIVYFGEIGVAKKREKVYKVYYRPIGFLNWFTSWKVLPNEKANLSAFHTKKDLHTILKEILLDDNNRITYIK